MSGGSSRASAAGGPSSSPFGPAAAHQKALHTHHGGLPACKRALQLRLTCRCVCCRSWVALWQHAVQLQHYPFHRVARVQLCTAQHPPRRRQRMCVGRTKAQGHASVRLACTYARHCCCPRLGGPQTYRRAQAAPARPPGPPGSLGWPGHVFLGHGCAPVRLAAATKRSAQSGALRSRRRPLPATPRLLALCRAPAYF